MTCTTISWPSCTSEVISGWGRDSGTTDSPAKAGRAGDTISDACRKAARSRPISTKAACMPGMTLCTRPLYRLPRTPRRELRSMCSSCSRPFSITATRVSRGVTLISSSSLGVISDRPQRNAEVPQQDRGFVQRQTHDPGIAAGDSRDESRSPTLHGVGTGFTERLSGGDVSGNLGFAQCRKTHLGTDQCGLLSSGGNQPDGGMHLMRAAGQLPQQGGGLGRVGWFAEHLAVDDHIGIGTEHDGLGMAAQLQQTGPGFFPGHALDVLFRMLAGLGLLVHRRIEDFETHAQLGQQFLSSRRL